MGLKSRKAAPRATHVQVDPSACASRTPGCDRSIPRTEGQVLGREGAFRGGGPGGQPGSPGGPSACASYSCVLALPPRPLASPLPSSWALPHWSPSPTSVHLASLPQPSSPILPQAPHQLL